MRAARCPGMCPERERCDRQRQARLHRLEVATGTAVKEWRRPAAGSEAAAPDELRPPDVLLRTVRHLVGRVVARAEPRAGAGPEPGDEAEPRAGAGPEPGDEAEPRAGAGPEPGDEAGAWAGAGPEPGDEAGAWAGAGPEPGDEAGAWAGTEPGDEAGAWAGAGPEPGDEAEPRAGAGPEPGDEAGAWAGAGDEAESRAGAEPGDEAWTGAEPGPVVVPKPGAGVGSRVKAEPKPGAGVGSRVKAEPKPGAGVGAEPAVAAQAAAEPGTTVMPEPWPLVHGFVMDRLRSVRQDMVSQRLGGRAAAAILEHSLRFLLCGQLWLGRPPPAPRARHSQPGSVEAQVRECFSRLLDAYSQGRDQYENQAEFQALALLYDLGSDHALHHALQLPPHIKDTPEMRAALGINRALAEGNYVRCLRVVRSLPFVESCAVYRHIASLRHQLLRAFSHGYSCCNCRYPLQVLVQILAVDTGDTAADLCRRHGQQVSGNSVCFQKGSYVEPDPDTQPALEELQLVTIKQRGRTRSSIIQGYKMPSTDR